MALPITVSPVHIKSDNITFYTICSVFIGHYYQYSLHSFFAAGVRGSGPEVRDPSLRGHPPRPPPRRPSPGLLREGQRRRIREGELLDQTDSSHGVTHLLYTLILISKIS